MGLSGRGGVLGALAVAMAVAAATVATAAGAATPAPVPCSAIGGGKYDCQFYPPGDGISGGAPVQAPNGSRVGYLNQGTNWVTCEAVGSTVASGSYENDWWAYTEANDRQWGWVNARVGHGRRQQRRVSGGARLRRRRRPAPGRARPTPAPVGRRLGRLDGVDDHPAPAPSHATTRPAADPGSVRAPPPPGRHRAQLARGRRPHARAACALPPPPRQRADHHRLPRAPLPGRQAPRDATRRPPASWHASSAVEMWCG